MKRYLKIIGTTLSLLLVMNARGALAETLPSNIHLQGDAEGIVFIPGDEPFLYKDNMVPGDRVERTMTINNKYEAPYTLYMRAERVTDKEEYDLLQKIQVKITYDGEVIYEGPVSGEDGLSKDIELGVFQPGDEAKLNAVATLDGADTGNEYRNKYGEVDWIFTAASDGPYIPPEKPEPVQPKTGDDSMVMYASLAIGSLVLLVLTFKKKKVNGEV